MDLFTDEEILAFCNHQAPKANLVRLLTRPTHFENGTAEDAKNNLYIIIAHDRWPFLLGLRSILKVKNKNRAYKWLLNGQPTKNTEALGQWGEIGPVLIPSQSHFSKQTKLEQQTRRKSWDSGAGKYAHPTQCIIIQNLGYSNQSEPMIFQPNLTSSKANTLTRHDD
jgi:hypothetical protein